MIITLPMYDRPETAAAHDRLLEGLRQSLPEAPATLSRDDTHWLNPDLLLSQTCSLPFRVALQDAVRIVGSPVHNLPCQPGYYYSEIIVRKDDERAEFKAYNGARLAINSAISQSGWAAIDGMANKAGIRFSDVSETGAHQLSAKAVAEGHADIAAIDAVTWQMIERWDDFAENLRVLCKSPSSPALPYVTALTNKPAPLQHALADAVRALSHQDREILCLIDITYVPHANYVLQPIPPSPTLADRP